MDEYNLSFGEADKSWGHKYINELLKQVTDEKVVLDDVITHRLLLSDVPKE